MNAERMARAIVELVEANLLRGGVEDEFSFRHALVHETVYSSLLRRDRQSLHLKVAQTLEQMQTRSGELRPPELAYHFHAAGAWEKALEYSRRAGELAQARHALREAIGHFGIAIDAAHNLGLVTPDLYRLRATAREVVGEFDAARADYETGLELARSIDDPREEWESLLRLGQLWAARDYHQAGLFVERALHLARTMEDPAVLARSLNRMGNWYANREQPHAAFGYHREALAIVDRAGDLHGVAETCDLLGLTAQLLCDPIQAAHYYGRAVTLFRELDDRLGLSSSVAILVMLLGTYHSFTVGTVDSLPEGILPETAVDVARSIGWRAGEAYGLLTIGGYLGARGQYTRGLKSARLGLRIAEEIEHQQWIAASHYSLGHLHLDLLAFKAAQEHFRQALTLAQNLGSLLWTYTLTGFLATAYALGGDTYLAESVLQAVAMPDIARPTLGQRAWWCARAEIALARNDPMSTLEIAGKLIDSAPGPAAASERSIPRIWYLRARALACLGKHVEATAVFRTLCEIAQSEGWQPLQWRCHAALATVYAATEQKADVEREVSTARSIVCSLAADVPDEQLRQEFLDAALATLS